MRACWVSLSGALASSATLLVEACSCVPQSPAEVSPNSSFAGTWEGKINDLPGVNIRIEATAGKISGTLVFYYQERSNTKEPWHVVGETPTPLLAPLVEGGTLTFEVQHHKCHGCAELGPNVTFRMELTGPNEARLWKLETQDPKKDLDPGLKLVRRREPAPSPKTAKSSE